MVLGIITDFFREIEVMMELSFGVPKPSILCTVSRCFNKATQSSMESTVYGNTFLTVFGTSLWQY
jgi:hypothetical protein